MRRLVFSLAAVIVTLALAGFLEIALSLLHLERYDREFVQRSSFPLYIPGTGPHQGFYVTNKYFWQTMNFQRFRLKKPAGVIRVFVVGGSAAYGWPGTDTDSFTGYLRRALDETTPGRFEIVNAAGISYGSHRVLDIVRDVVQFEPDLVVVCSGSNEYVEKNILPSMERKGGRLLVLRNLLSRTATYRAVRLALSRTPVLGTFMRKPLEDITDIRRTPLVHRGTVGRSPGEDREILANFRTNLATIAGLLGAAKVRGVFCTEPVNFRDWLPQRVPPRFNGAGEAERWKHLFDEGAGAVASDPVRAQRILGEVLALTPDDAFVAYLRGQSLLALGRDREARELFAIARERDARPMRALGSFTSALEEAASRPGMEFLDLAEIFMRESPHGITGAELIMDHCHLTPAGHRLVALSLLPVLARVSGDGLPLELLAEIIRQDDLPRPKDSIQRSLEFTGLGMAHENNGRLAEAEEAYRQALALAPGNPTALVNLGAIFIREGKLEEARDLLLRALASDPISIEACYNLGIVYLRLGDPARAAEQLEQVLRLNSRYPDALVALGDIARERGDWRGAIRRYEGALALGWDSLYTRLELTKAYLGLGEPAAARRELEQAMRFDPSDEEARQLHEQLSR